MRVNQLHTTGQLSDTIQWRFEVLNPRSIFITFTENGNAVVVEPRWIHIIKQCLDALQAQLAVQDNISAYTSLLVELAEPIESATLKTIAQLLSNIHLCQPDQSSLNVLVLPVFYDESVGQDLSYIASQKGMTVQDVIQCHLNTSYQVYALGFSPGFAFMGEVSERLRLPRRSTPRQCVPKGAVAIAENQTAIYPNESPGGWHIIGRCPTTLFNTNCKPASIFSVGQTVQFKAINQAEFHVLQQKADRDKSTEIDKVLERGNIKIIKAGGLAIVVDQGRVSAQQQGLTESGPMDAHAFYWANYLLANSPNSPMLEVSMGGLSLRVECDTVFALTGADLNAEIEGLDGTRQSISPWMSYRLFKDEILHIKFFKHKGLRSYIAFKGGLIFSHQPIFNSYSTVVRENLGGHKNNGSALQAGDTLNIHSTSSIELCQVSYLTATPYRLRTVINNHDRLTLKVVLAYQADLFTDDAISCFLNQDYQVSQLIDRMAYRLIASEKIAVPEGTINSEGTVVGSVQITPDGEPIVLMRDRQTIGGYPKIAVLDAKSINLLSQASPKQAVRFSLG